MLFCTACKRELVGVREVEKTEAIHELVFDPLAGWILGPKIVRWVAKPLDDRAVECGCGRFEVAEVAKLLEEGTVVTR